MKYDMEKEKYLIIPSCNFPKKENKKKNYVLSLSHAGLIFINFVICMTKKFHLKISLYRRCLPGYCCKVFQLFFKMLISVFSVIDYTVMP